MDCVIKHLQQLSATMGEWRRKEVILRDTVMTEMGQFGHAALERRTELCLPPHLLLGKASISPCSSLLSPGKVQCQGGTRQTCSSESVQQPLLPVQMH